MKKFQLALISSVAVACLSVSTLGFAHTAYKGEYKGYKGEAPCPVQPYLHDGFYVGAQAGYDAYAVGKSINVVDAVGDSIGESHPIATNGWAGGVLAGYGHYFNIFYLGAEGFFNGSSASSTSSFFTLDAPAMTGLSGTATFKARYEYGVAVLPGVKINDMALLYVRLGYNWARFKSNFTGTAAGVVIANVTDNVTSGGFNYGLGLESVVYKNLSVRGEYSHTKYRSFTSAGVNFNPSDNQFMLALIYHVA